MPNGQDEQSWTWPERRTTGQGSSTASQPDQEMVSYADALPRPQESHQSPGESSRTFQLRSAIVVVVTSLITTAIAFGVNISTEQAAALIGTVTALSSLVAIIVGDRRNG